ncbi:MAG: PaaI family thioesterase [Alphaproteobacteria bacterium]|nr:MAG: PaaI family thioesterase [Alphaproteobacteria bacterium]
MTHLTSPERADGQLDLQSLLKKVPYAQMLGMEVRQMGLEITTILPFQASNVGNPTLPALHGGAVAGFLEMTAMIELLARGENKVLPKPIDISIDYLRSGKPVETYARAVVTKHGRRVSNVQVLAWQADPEHPIARLHGHFFLKPTETE